ncbi:MAG: site-specific integrase [Planctomycetota bacterium]
MFKQQPQKVLSFKNPYDAIKQIINPSQIITIGELLDKYFDYTKKIIRPTRDHTEHPDLHFTKRVRKFLEPYLSWPVSDFGPDELLDVRNALVKYEYVVHISKKERDTRRATKKKKHTPGATKKKRYTRGGINDVINWIRKIWNWGMGRQLITVEQVQGLKEVKSLKMGDTKAPDIPKRARVTEEEFRKVINAVNSVVGDMLQLIWYTAMRPYEVCDMRPFDILFDDPKCWIYIPGRDQTPVGRHKTTRFERVKVIPLTSKCQKIMESRIEDFNSKKYIFSPKETMQEIREKKSANRKIPLKYGNRPGTNLKKHPMVNPGEKYNHHSLRNACKRGCKRAGVEIFVPYDLRRSRATGVRSVLGKEASKLLLGHANMDTTDIYLLEEVQEVMKVAKLLDTKE